MDAETNEIEQESNRSSGKIAAARARVPSLCDDDPDEIVTVRAPIAKLLGDA